MRTYISQLKDIALKSYARKLTGEMKNLFEKFHAKTHKELKSEVLISFISLGKKMRNEFLFQR